MMNETIHEEMVHEYGIAAPSPHKIKSIRVSALPHHIRESASKLDVDCDGALDAEEIADAISDLDKKEKTNRNLKKSISAIACLCALLITSVFGASITAAILAKDTTIDHDTGFAYVRGSHTEVMKTNEAIVWDDETLISDMSNDDLVDLKVIVLNEGAIRFDIKGFARNEIEDTVILLTEGGTVTYNFEGIISSTGEAKFLLQTIFGDDVHVEGSEGQRALYCACTAAASESGSTQSKKKKKKNNNN
jgi:hypothetical protein